ncbi:MAG: NAD-dependent epimerase/dehydratase family protein, partial [Phycisphaerae bacterium]
RSSLFLNRVPLYHRYIGLYDPGRCRVGWSYRGGGKQSRSNMSATGGIHSVLVTGATGFVGRHVVRELLHRGIRPVCLVRSIDLLFAQHSPAAHDRLIPIIGRLSDKKALQEAADLSQAAIHLVGIIIQRRLQGKTFRRIHVRGTERVLEALDGAGVRRLVHMSALGARSDAPAAYHRTKWLGEQVVRAGGLDWTIFCPSIIHGQDGEFMRLLRTLMCGLAVPVIPYFGTGRARVQPVAVEDVAHCMVASLTMDGLVGQVVSLGGPKAYSWIELYETCRRIMPGAKRLKPLVGQPVGVAKGLAYVTGPPLALAELVFPGLGMFRFDAGQVMMAQEDCVCDPKAVEDAFGIKLRDFEDELRMYAPRIG